MKSISGKNWEELKLSDRLIQKAKIDHNLTDIQAKLIISRNFTHEEIFSINNTVNFNNPFTKSNDFLSAIKLMKTYISNKSSILVIGDYDVDGCLSTSLMVNFLRKNKTKVNYYIPDRFKDGYGVSEKLIKKLTKLYEPQLIIFLDCGSSSYQALKFVKSKKIGSIIIDHHNTQKPYPVANVFINPKKKTGYEKYDYFCSVFLTYFFLDLYIKKNKLNLSIKDEQINVILGTIADVMPIRNINRFLAIKILKNFNINENFVFSYLFKTLNIKRNVEIDDLGYLIAPIINSAGRLDNANQIVELFTTNSNKLKISILKKIYNLNKKRKLLEYFFFKKFDFNSLVNQKGVLFIYNSNIPEGIIGIVASRFKEYFNKPCIVFTNSNKIVKGSARSTTDFNIGEYIQRAFNEKILISGGGHNLAAGVSLVKSKIDTFKYFLDNFYKEKIKSSENIYISRISINSINKNFVNKIELLGPFGNGNARPTFLIEKIKIIKPHIIKDKFISCFIIKNNKMIKAISFNHLNTNISYEILNSKNSFDIVVNINENKWNNKKSIQLEIIDLIKNIN